MPSEKISRINFILLAFIRTSDIFPRKSLITRISFAYEVNCKFTAAKKVYFKFPTTKLQAKIAISLKPEVIADELRNMKTSLICPINHFTPLSSSLSPTIITLENNFIFTWVSIPFK